MKMLTATQKLLGDVVRFGNGKAIKPGGEGRYPVYGSNGIIGGSEEFRHENAVIIGRVGAYCGAVLYCSDKFWASDNTLVAYPANAQVDTKFLYYLLADAKLSRYAGGAAQPLVTQTVLKQVEVNVPPLSVQQRIAAILSAYDELIENSQRRIKILESMARGLYREWFVYFRFPGHENHPRVASTLGEIPKGWEVRSVKDVATVSYGFPFQSKKFNTNQVGIPVIRIRDILDASTTTFTDEVADVRYHIKNGDILVGMDGDFHMSIWSSGHALQNQRVAKFESNGEIGNFHLYLALELPIQTWNKSIVGTTVAHLGDMHIKAIQIAWPTSGILKMASQQLEPISEQIIVLKRQIQNLRATRDLLLPRLLSGHIEVEAT